MVKKIVFGVFVFAAFMVLAGGAAVASKTIKGVGSAVGGGAGMVATVFIPAVYDGVTSGAGAPASKPGPNPASTKVP